MKKFFIKYRKKIIIFLFGIYSLFIVYYTLLSRNISETHKIELRFMWAYQEMFAGNPAWKEDIWYNIGNVVFFIPFGFLYPKKNWKIILVSGAIFSLLIEVIQYVGCLGLCELDDLICNSAGALIRFWLYKFIKNCIIKRFGACENENNT